MKTSIKRTNCTPEIVPAKPSGHVAPTIEEIRRRAYEIFKPGAALQETNWRIGYARNRNSNTNAPDSSTGK